MTDTLGMETTTKCPWSSIKPGAIHLSTCGRPVVEDGYCKRHATVERKRSEYRERVYREVEERINRYQRQAREILKEASL